MKEARVKEGGKEKGEIGSQLAKGSTVGSIALAVGYFTQYLFQVSVSRILGTEDAGKLFVAFAFVLLVSIIARLGLDKTGLKIVAIHFSGKRLSSIREVFLLASLLVGTVSVVTAVLVCCAGSGLTGFILLLHDESGSSLIYFSIPLVALTIIYSEVLRGMRLIGVSSVVQLVMPYGIAIVFIWSAYYLIGSEIRIGLYAFIAGYAVSMLLGFYFILNITENCKAPLFSHFYEMTDGAPSMLWSSLVLFGISGADVIILSYFVPPSEVAYYFAASRTSMLISVGMAGINSIVAPMVASACRDGDAGKLERIARMGARLSLTAAIFIIGFLFIGGEWVLSLFGKGYEGSFELLLVFLIGQLANTTVGTVAFIMFMSGQEKSAARILTMVIIVMLGLYVAVIPEYGITGAAVVTAFGVVAWNFSMMIRIYRKLNIVTYADNFTQCLLYLFVVAAIAYFCKVMGVALFPLLTLYALFSPVILWKFILLHEDRDAMMSVVGRYRGEA